MNISLKTSIIQDLENLNYEVTHFDKKIIDIIVEIYNQIRDCDKELNKEGLIVEVKGKIQTNPRLDAKLKLLSTLKTYLGMFPLDVKTKIEFLIEKEIEEEVFGTDDDFYADDLVLEM